MQEDHVSMGWAAGQEAADGAGQPDQPARASSCWPPYAGLQLRAPLTPSPAGAVAVRRVAEFAGEPGPDRFLAPVLEQARALVVGPDLRSEIEAVVGRLA